MPSWKVGVNTLLWALPITRQDLDLVDRVADLGFDAIELCTGTFEPQFEVAALRRRLQRRNLACTLCAVPTAEADPTSDDPAIRERARAYLRGMLQLCHELGAPILGGPLFAEVPRSRYLPPERRAAERRNAVEAIRDVLPEAERYGVEIALEPLNRFETDVVNTVDDAVRMCEEIGSERVGLHLDTFHQHLEEKNGPDAVRRAGRWLKHMHFSENDRGIPGTGSVDWRGTVQAMKDVGYQGMVVIEGFSRNIPSLVQNEKIVRPLAPADDDIATAGLAFIRRLLAEMGVGA